MILSGLVGQFKADIVGASGDGKVSRMTPRSAEKKAATKPAARPAAAASAKSASGTHTNGALARKQRSTLDEWQEF